MIKDVMQDAEGRMKGAITALEADLASFRTGRASPHLLDRLVVEVYGVEMPLNQVATVSVPEPQQLAIRPYDQKNLGPIERAVLKSDLGLTPNNDGKMIRLNLPRLTEERRRDLTRLVGKRLEEARVAVRNVRRDALNDLRGLKNSNKITEDELHQSQDDLQKVTDRYVSQIDDMGRLKEAEIMEI
jgi:ribosome recycling factor